MIILTLRTDKSEAELGLYNDESKLAYHEWPAHRELAETIHLKIRQLLERQKLSIKDLQGIVVFKGPGSFTGLRIGLSVANALSDSLSIPIVSETGKDWLDKGRKRLEQGEDERLTIPDYGSEPHITLPKK